MDKISGHGVKFNVCELLPSVVMEHGEFFFILDAFRALQKFVDYWSVP